MLMKKKTSLNGFRLFKILTRCMIIILLYYIGAKLSSLVVTGQTREILIIETKEYLTKKIKDAMCNEILISDEYLTEDRVIRLSTIQKNRKSMSSNEVKMDNYIARLNSYKIDAENTLVKLKENIEKSIGNINNIEVSYNNKNEDRLMTYTSTKKQTKENISIVNKLKESNDYEYMLNKFFMVDGNTSVDKNIFKPKQLLKVNNGIKKDSSKPQILIYHTHGSEKYADSRKGKQEDTVVGVGAYLHDLLVEKYGYNVIHNTKSYDVIDGKWNRNAYDTALSSVKKILEDNKSIEVVIDLHRDSGKEKVVTNIDGISVAKVMFFNGVSRSKTQSRKELNNPNLKENIAFSLAMQIKSMSLYKDFTKKIYLKGYRYNMHLAPKATLIEVGNNKNTVAEAKNAMVLYAKILNEVLQDNR